MPETTNYLKHANSNPVQKYLIGNFYKNVYSMLKPLRSVKILDVGCGEGFTLKKLEEKRIGKTLVGVDNTATAIKIGRNIYPHLDLRKGDIYKLDFPDNEFDLVLCTEVLEHLKDPKAAVEELKRVSRKYILFSVPNEPFFIIANFLRGKYLKSLGNHPEHINHWSFFSFEKFLRKNGLHISKSRHPFAWSVVLVRK